MTNKPYTLHLGNCLDVLKTLPDNSVDSIVTDPPYELGFMGKKWDNTGIANSVEMWSECFRVLKHGGHLLSFSGSRTYHRMTCAIEDAGFDIRDQIMWVYGSGFPKSMNISKAIDKSAGVEREVIGVKPGHEEFVGRKTKGHIDFKDATDGFDRPWMHDDKKREMYHMETAPSTPEAKQWDGWGTALKPAHEPICVARKPLSEKTIVDNVMKHGTGGLNIDGCRVEFSDNDDSRIEKHYKHNASAEFCPSVNKNNGGGESQSLYKKEGRFPANFIHDGSDEVLALFPNNNAGCKPHIINASDETEYNNKQKGWGSVTVPKNKLAGFDDGDNLSAARFFYCAKTSKNDRDEDNNHPTVKPTELMRYLVRLVTPPNGSILDPFMGSGSTGKAAMLEGFKFVGIDMTPEYMTIAEARIKHAHENKDLPVTKSKKVAKAVEVKPENKLNF